MVVNNKNGIGNPNHSDSNGQFVSSDSTDSKKEESVEKDKSVPSWAKKIEPITQGSTPSWIKSSSQSTPSAPQVSNSTIKPIEQMTDDEIKDELNQIYPKLKNNFSFDLQRFMQDAFNGDLKIQLSMFRKYNDLLDRFPLDASHRIKLRTTTKEKYIAACEFNVFSIYTNSYNTKINNYERLVINNDEFNRGYDACKKWFKRLYQARQFMQCSDDDLACYAMTHEYGHLFEDEIFKQSKRKINTYILKNEVLSIYSNDNPGVDYHRHLSKYGDTNGAEFFAECFANMECGATNKLGEAFKKWLIQNGFYRGKNGEQQ